MSGSWYAAALPERSEAAWEIYHENAKRGPDEPMVAPRGPGRVFPYAGLPELVPATAATDAPALAAGQLLPLLAAGGRPLCGDDPVMLFLYPASVTSLPPVLAVHDPSGPCLRLLVEDVSRAEVGAALPAGTLETAAAIVFLAADLDAATATAGERGYRDALIAIGRHLAALEAAAPAGVTVQAVAFQDRAADALLYLDGLSRSVLAAVAIGTTDG